MKVFLKRLTILSSDIWRKIRTIDRVASQGKWKFFRFAVRTMFVGIATPRCKQCGASNWHTASSICSICGVNNLFLALESESDPCIACGEDTNQICENCEFPLCYVCDSQKYHDVLTCKDEAACEKRCAENEAKA